MCSWRGCSVRLSIHLHAIFHCYISDRSLYVSYCKNSCTNSYIHKQHQIFCKHSSSTCIIYLHITNAWYCTVKGCELVYVPNTMFTSLYIYIYIHEFNTWTALMMSLLVAVKATLLRQRVCNKGQTSCTRWYVKVNNGQEMQIVASLPLFMASWFALVKWSLSCRTEEHQNHETVSRKRQHLSHLITSALIVRLISRYWSVYVGCLAWAELCHTLLAAEVEHVTVTGLARHSRLHVVGWPGDGQGVPF